VTSAKLDTVCKKWNFSSNSKSNWCLQGYTGEKCKTHFYGNFNKWKLEIDLWLEAHKEDRVSNCSLPL